MTAAAQGGTFAIGDVVREVLPNGLTVLVRRDPSAPVCAIVTHVRAGYFDEPDRVSGVAHVLEHMYFKGTPTRAPGEIARDTKRVGGYLNAGTIYDYTMYYAVLPASGFLDGLDVQFDAYAHSLIDPDELQREIEVILEEERRKRDTASAVAAESCYALLHDVHRIRRWRIGTPEGLRALTRDDVVAFYRTHYVPSNTILSIVGDLDVAQVMAAVRARYGTLPDARVPRDRGPTESDPPTFRWQALHRDVTHTHLVLAWRTVPPTHPDRAALDVAVALLSGGRASRLYREVRERGLVTTIGASHYAPEELGMFVVQAQSPPPKAAEAIATIHAGIRALAAQAPSAAELARVQRGFEARWWRRMESMEGQATMLSSWEALGHWELGPAHLAELMTVTPAMVQQVVAKYLSLDATSIVTLQPHESPAIAESPAALRAQLAAAIVPERVTQEEPPVAVAAIMTGTPRAERAQGGALVYRTPAGIPILVRQKPGARVAHIDVVFRGGTASETPDDAGRTTLLVRTAVQGTTSRAGPRLAEEMESVGGDLGHAVRLDSFSWMASGPTSALPTVLALLADVIQAPTFDATVLETERGIARSSLAELRDDMGAAPLRLALADAFPGHHYARPALGTEAGLRSADPEALHRWHRHRVLAAPAAVVAVADGDPDAIAAMVSAAFARLTWAEASALPMLGWPQASVERVEQRSKAQSAIALLLPGPRRGDALRPAASVLATLASGLGGRFFTALRERESLAYAINVGAQGLSAAGWFSSYLACAPEKEAQARAGLLREWGSLADTLVGDEELARAKAYLIGARAIRRQSAAALAGELANAWVGDALDALPHKEAAIAAVTAQDVRLVAQQALAAAPLWGIVRGTGST
jgi:zinc protease